MEHFSKYCIIPFLTKLYMYIFSRLCVLLSEVIFLFLIFYIPFTIQIASIFPYHTRRSSARRKNVFEKLFLKISLVEVVAIGHYGQQLGQLQQVASIYSPTILTNSFGLKIFFLIIFQKNVFLNFFLHSLRITSPG